MYLVPTQGPFKSEGKVNPGITNNQHSRLPPQEPNKRYKNDKQTASDEHRPGEVLRVPIEARPEDSGKHEKNKHEKNKQSRQQANQSDQYAVAMMKDHLVFAVGRRWISVCRAYHPVSRVSQTMILAKNMAEIGTYISACDFFAQKNFPPKVAKQTAIASAQSTPGFGLPRTPHVPRPRSDANR